MALVFQSLPWLLDRTWCKASPAAGPVLDRDL